MGAEGLGRLGKQLDGIGGGIDGEGTQGPGSLVGCSPWGC